MPDRFEDHEDHEDARDPRGLVRPYVEGLVSRVWRRDGGGRPALRTRRSHDGLNTAGEQWPEPAPSEPISPADWPVEATGPPGDTSFSGVPPDALGGFPDAPERPGEISTGQNAQPTKLMGSQMSKQDELARVIYDIRSSIPELHGVMIASVDGIAISHDFSESEAERVAAMAATALGLGKRMTERTNLGGLQESVVRGDHGYLVVYAAGQNAVLVMAGPANSNLGLMRIEARSASAVVSKVLG